jgi:hypothetical protein
LRLRKLARFVKSDDVNFLAEGNDREQNCAMLRLILFGIVFGLLAGAEIHGQTISPDHGKAGRVLPEQVDINRASIAELMTVPGMTASWAGRIVRFRPYHSKYELVQLGVVTPDVYRRIRPNVIAHRLGPGEQMTSR